MFNLSLLPLSYLVWHYSEAFRDGFRVWSNFIWFEFHFFSIGILLKTLFSPWKRLAGGGNGREKEVGGLFGKIILSLLTRIFGFFARVFTITLGLFSLGVTLVAGVFFFATWILLPFMVVGLFGFGILSISVYFI